MATALVLARGPATVNTLLKPIARAAQALCGQAAAGAGPRELEEGVWRVVQASRPSSPGDLHGDRLPRPGRGGRRGART
ncbi:MAG: hypothetical protein R3F43_27695 [bacterium]